MVLPKVSSGAVHFALIVSSSFLMHPIGRYSFVDQVPPEYIRKQTLTGGERYITDELKRHEDEVLTAQVKANDLELSKLINYMDSHAVKTKSFNMEDSNNKSSNEKTFDTYDGILSVTLRGDICEF